MILDDIVASTRKRVARLQAGETLQQWEARLTDAPPPRPFAAALKHPDRLGLIAEIKKASPSKGLIAPDFNSTRQAALYREAGADCLSVLTEPEFFQGDLSHLQAAREASGKPCLRKEFILDPLQVAEARMAGADCILLIAAILSDWELRQLKALAHRYGMDALVEIHDEAEARRAVANGCQFIGINNRDLKTFEVDLNTTARLRPLLPGDAIIVAESGVATREDARRLREAGADALLVGETLMRSGDVSASVEELTRW